MPRWRSSGTPSPAPARVIFPAGRWRCCAVTGILTRAKTQPDKAARVPNPLFQRQRLVAEHPFCDDVSGQGGVERMQRDQIVAFGGDLVDILHQLELFVAILAVQAHALTDDIENVENAKRPIALVGA